MQQPPDRSEISSPSSASRSHAHTLAAPMLRFDLWSEIAGLRQEGSYAKRTPAGRTLVKEPDLRIVLMALKGGARLEEHRTSGPISIQVLEGHIRLRLAEGSIELTSGELLMLEPAIPHDVDAIEDSAFLLTLGRTTYQQVSDRHELRD